MKINIKEKIQELQSAVFKGEELAIDNWFTDNNFNKKTKFAREVAHQICNSNYFFSFRAISTNKEFLKQEELRRENTILKHFFLKKVFRNTIIILLIPLIFMRRRKWSLHYQSLISLKTINC